MRLNYFICFAFLTSTIFNAYPQIIHKAKPRILYGVNGHPLNQKDYLAFGIKSQINSIKDLNFTAYRVDVLLNLNGTIALQPKKFDSLLSTANYKGIVILPMIYMDKVNYEGSGLVNNDLGYNMGKKFLLSNTSISFLELGNEMDLWFMKKDIEKSKYLKNKRFMMLSAYMKGFIRGVKEVKSSVKIVVGFSFSNSWFLKVLDQSGVKFDIIGNNYYSNIDFVSSGYLSMLTDINNYFAGKRNIWITEFNHPYGSKWASAVAQKKSFSFMLNNCPTLPNVKAIFVYELLDEPQLDVKEDRNFERELGVLKIVADGQPQIKDFFRELNLY